MEKFYFSFSFCPAFVPDHFRGIFFFVFVHSLNTDPLIIETKKAPNSRIEPVLSQHITGNLTKVQQ